MNPDFQGIYPNEYNVFDIYFASLCSLQVHPGAGTKGQTPLTLEQCRDMAIEMLKLRRKLPVMEEVPCPGAQ